MPRADAASAPETFAAATHVAFPGLVGVVPGVGRFDPCDWGLGFELHDGKAPHWMAPSHSPATFGHFGGAGTFLWVDPVVELAAVVLTDREFGPWALAAWPAFSEAGAARRGAVACSSIDPIRKERTWRSRPGSGGLARAS